MAAAQAKAHSNRGNKENPAQSPLRQKGSNKKQPAAAFADENAISVFGPGDLSQSGAKQPVKQASGKGAPISEQPLSKAKQLFGDSTSAMTNIVVQPPQI